MKFSGSVKKKIKTVAIFALIGMILGPVYANLNFGFAWFRIPKGMISGMLITSICAAFEIFWFDEKLKRLKFSLVIIIRSLFYITVISLSVIPVVALHESVVLQISLWEYLMSNEFTNFLFYGDFPSIFLFAVTASFAINFFWQINKLLGRNILLNYITGRYHHPIEEVRIFMFLDLKSSTNIAEKLGPVQFHNLLNDFFFDITNPIIECKGEIYQYVGDEIVITWSEEKGAKDLNCIECFFKIRSVINELSKKYIERYGLVPEFKTGIHIGKVVTGEIGDVKRDIAFHGDAINTSSRIQHICNSLNRNILISADLLSRLNLNGKYEPENVGKIKLRGKENETELYSIVELKQ